ESRRDQGERPEPRAEVARSASAPLSLFRRMRVNCRADECARRGRGTFSLYCLPAETAVALQFALDAVILEALRPSKANHIIDGLRTGTPFVYELAGAITPMRHIRSP